MSLEPIKVSLIDHMGNDLSVVDAARVSFDKKSTMELVDVKWEYNDDGDIIDRNAQWDLKEGDKRLLSYLAKHNHWSPFSHVYASFRIRAPIFVARQLAKHQVGLSWNEVSRRYVSTTPSHFIPAQWRKKADNKKQGSSEESVEGQKDIDNMVTECYDISRRLYDVLLMRGVCPEQARMVLAQGMNTEWIWSGSLYAFARVFNLRTDAHSQAETREVAEQIGKCLKKVFPNSWEVLTNANE